MDDVFEAMERRRRRFNRLRRAKARRDVNYAELLRPSVAPEERCPHTLQPIPKTDCSQCSGVRVKRSQPKAVVPISDEE